MHEYADRLASGLVSIDDELACEFEARLVDSSALAVRVAYSVVRQQQDAEDVAQQALVRAYRHYRRLRDRDRFRAWLVRTTWRLALDWKRDHQRRARREQTAAALRPPSGNAESDVLASDRAARLWTAIDDLPGRQRVPAESFKSYLLVVPPEPIAKAFGAVAKTTMEAMKRNDEESCTLAALRDALLPKLLSGEIRVGNIKPLLKVL